MDQIFKVKSTGKYSQMPDEMLLTFNFHYHYDTYEEAVEKSAIGVANFIDFLLNKGVKKEEYHTLGFRIQESYKEEPTDQTNRFGDPIMKKVMDGYIYTQVLKVNLDFDLDFLRDLMLDISKMETFPRLNLDFGIKDMEAAKAKALEDAFSQCEKKAIAMGKILKKESQICVEINHNVEENYSTAYVAKVAAMNSLETVASASKTPSVDYKKIINPDEISVHETLITIWRFL